MLHVWLLIGHCHLLNENRTGEKPISMYIYKTGEKSTMQPIYISIYINPRKRGMIYLVRICFRKVYTILILDIYIYIYISIHFI